MNNNLALISPLKHSRSDFHLVSDFYSVEKTVEPLLITLQ